MDDNPEIRDRLNVNKSTYHNKRPRERFICFIRGAKWTKMNQLNGPIYKTCLLLFGYVKKSPLKVLQTSFRPLQFPVNKCVQATLTHAQTLRLAVPKGIMGKKSDRQFHWWKAAKLANQKSVYTRGYYHET